MKKSDISLFSRLHLSWRERGLTGEFWALVVAVVLFNLGVSIFFFLYNLLMLDLGLRERSLGILASAMALGSMAGTIPMGIVARRAGLKKVLIVCLLSLAIAFGGRVFLPWYPAQLMLAFFDGVMLCGWVVCLSPAVANVVEGRQRPFAFGVLFAAAVATGSLGGYIGGNMPTWCQGLAIHRGIVLSATESKRSTLLAACFITAFAALPVAYLRSDTQALAPPRIIRPTRFLRRFLLASACWAGAVGAFNPFTNVFFSKYLGAATSHLGNFFSIAQLLQASAVLLMSLFLRRIKLTSWIVIAQLTTAVAVGLLAAGRSLLQEEAFYCIFMAAQHICDPGFQSLLMDNVMAEDRSGATALYFLTISIAQAVAAAAAGAAFMRFGYPPVLAGISIATIGAAITFRTLCPARVTIQKHQPLT